MNLSAIISSAVLLATLWLASGQEQVKLPVASRRLYERRKSSLFPKMDANFVVTERAILQQTIKMADRRNNVLLPRLELKDRIMDRVMRTNGEELDSQPPVPTIVKASPIVPTGTLKPYIKPTTPTIETTTKPKPAPNRSGNLPRNRVSTGTLVPGVNMFSGRTGANKPNSFAKSGTTTSGSKAVLGTTTGGKAMGTVPTKATAKPVVEVSTMISMTSPKIVMAEETAKESEKKSEESQSPAASDDVEPKATEDKQTDTETDKDTSSA